MEKPLRVALAHLMAQSWRRTSGYSDRFKGKDFGSFFVAG